MSYKTPNLNYRKPSFSSTYALTQGKQNYPKYKEERMIQTQGYSSKDKYFEATKFNSLKTMKNRSNMFGFKTKNDFMISNKFKDSNLVKKSYSLNKNTFMNIYKESNKYEYKNAYSVSVKYKNYPKYSYSSKLVDTDKFNIKTIIKI